LWFGQIYDVKPYQLPTITLPLAAVTTEVVVRPTEVMADQQLKAQEKQRVFDVIPDFYTSYLWDAVGCAVCEWANQ
jgi:hypothetical protein